MLHDRKFTESVHKPIISLNYKRGEKTLYVTQPVTDVLII